MSKDRTSSLGGADRRTTEIAARRVRNVDRTVKNTRKAALSYCAGLLRREKNHKFDPAIAFLLNKLKEMSQ